MTNNNLMCDLETGICGVAGDDDMEVIDFNQPKKTIDLYYVTDPICSHCWALEPTFRRFKEQYGHYFNFHTVLGGLLEKWHGGPVDPANGIHGPADVAGHWREVGEYSRMPIDGSLMIDNPVQSSSHHLVCIKSFKKIMVMTKQINTYGMLEKNYLPSITTSLKNL